MAMAIGESQRDVYVSPGCSLVSSLAAEGEELGREKGSDDEVVDVFSTEHQDHQSLGGGTRLCLGHQTPPSSVRAGSAQGRMCTDAYQPL